MSFKHAMSIFIMENVNCFDKKLGQLGKCIIAISIKFLESQYKTVLKTLRIFKYNQFFNFR